MVTLEQAIIAKNAVKIYLGRPDWLRGVGVGSDDKGYFVKVNVVEATPEIMSQIATECPGVSVRIQVEAVGNIVALDEP